MHGTSAHSPLPSPYAHRRHGSLTLKISVEVSEQMLGLSLPLYAVHTDSMSRSTSSYRGAPFTVTQGTKVCAGERSCVASAILDS